MPSRQKPIANGELCPRSSVQFLFQTAVASRQPLSESGRGGGGSGRRRCSGRRISGGVSRRRGGRGERVGADQRRGQPQAGRAWEPEEWQEQVPASSVRRQTDRQPEALVPEQPVPGQ